MTRKSASRSPSPAMLTLGAVAIGALALGAVAIAYLAIENLAVKRARFRKLTIDDLTINRLRAPFPRREEGDDPWANHEEIFGIKI